MPPTALPPEILYVLAQRLLHVVVAGMGSDAPDRQYVGWKGEDPAIDHVRTWFDVARPVTSTVGKGSATPAMARSALTTRQAVIGCRMALPCWPMADAAGNEILLPEAADIDSAAQRAARATWNGWAAARTAAKQGGALFGADLSDDVGFAVGQLDPQPPSGGVIAGQFLVTADLL